MSFKKLAFTTSINAFQLFSFKWLAVVFPIFVSSEV
jgi:hypothetical protein